MVLQYLAALGLIGHGIGHTTGFFESWTSMRMGFHDRPWIFDNKTKLKSPTGKAFGILGPCAFPYSS